MSKPTPIKWFLDPGHLADEDNLRWARRLAGNRGRMLLTLLILLGILLPYFVFFLHRTRQMQALVPDREPSLFHLTGEAMSMLILPALMLINLLRMVWILTLRYPAPEGGNAQAS